LTSRILSVSLDQESGVVLARQRARQVAEQLGFSPLEQTQIATAVSEIARNAFEYAGSGLVEFSLTGKTSPQVLEIRVSDKGRGIVDLQGVLAGTHRSQTGMGVGIRGAQRLMDQFHIDSKPGKGTVVELLKILPRKKDMVGKQALLKIADYLAQEKPADTGDELRRQKRRAALEADPEDVSATAPDEHADGALRREVVRVALERLTPRERELVALKFAGGLSHEEIARVLGISASNAGTRLHRTLEKLRRDCDADA